jgi:PTH1 family peptidyl-tRNA hydrolase
MDDLALPFGTIRLRPRGSDGGHNGMTSIIQVLGMQEFARLRFGIGGDFPYGMQVEYVLGKWSREEFSQLPDKITVCHEIIRSFGTAGVEKTMNLFNNR